MHKQTLIFYYNEMLRSNKKKWSIAESYNMGGFQNNYTESVKPHKRKMHSACSIYIKIYKMQNEKYSIAS